MGTETMDDNQKNNKSFHTAGDAASFAETIADTIKESLRKDSDTENDEAEAINIMLGKSSEEDMDEETDMGHKKSEKGSKEKAKKSRKVISSDYSSGHAYGIDNIALRNEVVQEKRRAIRVESQEDKEVLSDAIQKHLEESVFGEAKIQEGFHIVNIMQECLKSENILEYMQNMSCCTCERCQADVLAATLSHLPAKYVVMYKKNTNARISFYHDNYKMDILSSIMRAIRDVKEHPHHGNDRIQ
ncbi:Late competence development protein ComFB [Lachnospiraceae bacterium JC7]|nr:Late competence development protein ComFB [Lachnospiraceae bacterium JC7]